jgi:endonuclease YncB( thermonuclease family)
MATAIKKQSSQKAKKVNGQPEEYQEPKRLSKAGIWRRNNPGGIGVIIDRKAVNK